MESFPDDQLTVSNQIVEGITAVGEWTAEATNTGSLHLPSGEVLPPTGKHYTNRGIDMAVFEDGRVKSHRLYWDTTEILAQLGRCQKRSPSQFALLSLLGGSCGRRARPRVRVATEPCRRGLANFRGQSGDRLCDTDDADDEEVSRYPPGSGVRPGHAQPSSGARNRAGRRSGSLLADALRALPW